MPSALRFALAAFAAATSLGVADLGLASPQPTYPRTYPEVVPACAGEPMKIIKTFEFALNTKNDVLMVDLFSKEGVVYGPKGKSYAKPFFKGLMQSMVQSTVVEEYVYCGIGPKNSIVISVRYRHWFTKDDGTVVDGIYFSQFQLEKSGGRKGGLLLVTRLDIFGNHFAKPSKDLPRKTSQIAEQAVCPKGAIDLALKYVDALGARDSGSLRRLFAKDGYVLSTSQGHKLPTQFFGRDGFLTKLEDAKCVVEQVSCQMTKGRSPMIAVRFEFDYKMKGAKHFGGGVYVDVFGFGRDRKTGKLHLKYSEMFENEVVKHGYA